MSTEWKLQMSEDEKRVWAASFAYHIVDRQPEQAAFSAMGAVLDLRGTREMIEDRTGLARQTSRAFLNQMRGTEEE